MVSLFPLIQKCCSYLEFFKILLQGNQWHYFSLSIYLKLSLQGSEICRHSVSLHSWGMNKSPNSSLLSHLRGENNRLKFTYRCEERRCALCELSESDIGQGEKQRIRSVTDMNNVLWTSWGKNHSSPAYTGEICISLLKSSFHQTTF